MRFSSRLLAVAPCFSGTQQEWHDSLRGEPGAAGVGAQQFSIDAGSSISSTHHLCPLTGGPAVLTVFESGTPTTYDRTFTDVRAYAASDAAGVVKVGIVRGDVVTEVCEPPTDQRSVSCDFERSFSAGEPMSVPVRGQGLGSVTDRDLVRISPRAESA